MNSDFSKKYILDKSFNYGGNNKIMEGRRKDDNLKVIVKIVKGSCQKKPEKLLALREQVDKLTIRKYHYVNFWQNLFSFFYSFPYNAKSKMEIEILKKGQKITGVITMIECFIQEKKFLL